MDAFIYAFWPFIVPALVMLAWWIALTIFRGGNHRSPQEQAAEDAEQLAAVSRPADLDKFRPRDLLIPQPRGAGEETNKLKSTYHSARVRAGTNN